MLRSIAVAVLEETNPFELGVACEVFGVDRTDYGVPAFDFRVCGPQAHVPIATNCGLDIVAPHDFSGLADADLVIVAPGHQVENPPAELLDQLRAADRRGAWILSLCTAAFVLAEAGLLDGRRSTTHWFQVDRLRRRYPQLTLELDVLWVEDGNIITSAGTAAGIDAALHLVRLEHGSAAASMIARRMVVPPHRDGGQRQYVEAPVPDLGAETLQPVLEWAVEHLDQPLDVPTLARRALLSGRTFARRFRQETGHTPHQWVTHQRVLLARRLLESTDATVDAIAAQCGLGAAANLRHHFVRATGVSPQVYRRSFSDSARAS